MGKPSIYRTTDYQHVLHRERAMHEERVDRPRAAKHTSPKQSASNLLAPLVGSVIALGLVAVIVLVFLGTRSAVLAYTNRILPLVTVGGFAVGSMTQQEAAVFLQQQYARKVAILSTPGGQAVATWEALGVSIDAASATHQAFDVGRTGGLPERLQSWWHGKQVQPYLRYDPTVASAYLSTQLGDTCPPPQNADVSIRDGVATAVPSVAGCEVDTEATLRDLYSMMIREQTVPIRTRQVFPVVNDSNPAVDQINEWLARPFTLKLWFNNGVVTRTVASRERMSWMQTSVEAQGLAADLNTEAIGKYLAEVALELGPNAALRQSEAAGLVRNAMLRGEATAWLVAPRKQIHYTVEPGDTFDRLADRFGIPSPRLISANPDVEPNDLMIGQQIVIPAQGSMLPVTIQADNLKHIEIDLSTQSMQAFDGDQVVLTAKISSGIPKWRTLDGVYQIQNKVDEAYNSLAHVRMPNWLTLYDLAEPGSTSNGIHALPILQSGKRLWDGYLGKPVSFGCIVMGVKDSDFLYQWADVGTPVVIHGVTPPSTLNYDNLVEAQKTAK